jgi:hypothetical protein
MEEIMQAADDIDIGTRSWNTSGAVSLQQALLKS